MGRTRSSREGDVWWATHYTLQVKSRVVSQLDLNEKWPNSLNSQLPRNALRLVITPYTASVGWFFQLLYITNEKIDLSISWIEDANLSLFLPSFAFRLIIQWRNRCRETRLYRAHWTRNPFISLWIPSGTYVTFLIRPFRSSFRVCEATKLFFLALMWNTLVVSSCSKEKMEKSPTSINTFTESSAWSFVWVAFIHT